MTRTSIGFIVSGMVVYLIASQSQINWLYLFDAIIWSLLLLSVILGRYGLRSLQVEQQVLLPDSATGNITLGGPVEDETVEVKLTVRNKGRLARHFISLLVDCPFEQPENSQKDFILSTLRSRSSLTFSYSATCYRRGHYAYSDIILKSVGPLGLFSRRRVLQLPLNLTVYPTYYRMEGLHTAGETWIDWGEGLRSGAASQFYSSREYQFGDPLKYIHWRNTARLGHFMIKEFEQSSRGSVAVIFETGQDFGEGRETTLEYSIKIAASLAKLCTDTGCGIDIQGGEESLHNAGWQRAMGFLAHLEVKEDSTPAEFAVIPEPGQAVIAVIPAVMTGLSSALLRLVNRAGKLSVVLLEGFDDEEAPDRVLARLGRTDLNVYRCSRGNIEEVIDRLGRSLLYAASSEGV
ncbi:DUF58 domain-containing protein [Chloroflexota bacterium]